MNPLDPRAIVEAASSFATVFHRRDSRAPAMRCYLHGAIEMLKRLQGDTAPEPWSDDYNHEARLRELLQQSRSRIVALSGPHLGTETPSLAKQSAIPENATKRLPENAPYPAPYTDTEELRQMTAGEAMRRWGKVPGWLRSKPSAVSAPTAPSDPHLGTETPAPTAAPEAPGTAPATATPQDCSNRKAVKMSYRTDRNNNPVAFTTDIAKQAGLTLDTDYTEGEPFDNGRFHTAKLLGDPIEITIRVIDRIGFTTAAGVPRWAYIDLPNADWQKLSFFGKREIIHLMYHQEGGTELEHLFQPPPAIVTGPPAPGVNKTPDSAE